MKSQTLNIIERARGSLFFLSFKNLSLSVGCKIILSNVSCGFGYDGIVLIKGPVGSGKSSILKMLGGLIDPCGGHFVHERNGIPMSGVYIHSQPEFNFITGYVKDELAFAGVPEESFSGILSRSIYDMSGGELKKLSLMMAVAGNTGVVLLADEPLDMLDDAEARSTADFIIKESQNRPFIIATHDSHFDEAADVIITVGG